MKKFAILFIICVCVCACKTPKVTPLIEHRDRVTHDTVTCVDSVYVARYVREKGDTVIITDTLFKFKYLDKMRDIYIHDSVPYEVPVPVRMRNGYDRFTSWGFWIFVILILLRVAWRFVKKYYLHI